MKPMLFLKTHILLIIIISYPALAEKLNIAVASNFAQTMKRITTHYKDKTGEQINLLIGSSGKHHLQIFYGAPIDVFFSADQVRPQALFEKGKSEKPFTYAIGKLAYWMPSYSGKRISFEQAVQLPVERKVIANPKHAPYGRAAQEVLEKLSLWRTGNKEARYIFAENINQSYTMIQSKAVQAGFVAYAQLKQSKVDNTQYWLVPHAYSAMLKQDAVIIRPSKQLSDFLSFFSTKRIQTLLEADGYQLP